MKKIIVLTTLIGLLLIGCSKEEQIIEINEDMNTEESSEERVYDMVGEIVEFRDNEVHIMTGDIIDIYTVSNEMQKNFYLGETVGLIEDGESYEMLSYKTTDFDSRFTTMGQKIESVTGEVTEISEEKIVIIQDDMVFEFDLDGPVFANLGDRITLDYMEMAEEQYVMAIYNETNKLTTTVISINRGEDGSFIVNCGSDGEVAYIATLNNSVKNFNMNELKKGDDLDLYFEVMALSYPAQMAPKKAIKVN